MEKFYSSKALLKWLVGGCIPHIRVGYSPHMALRRSNSGFRVCHVYGHGNNESNLVSFFGA